MTFTKILCWLKDSSYRFFLTALYWVFIRPFGFWARHVSDPLNLAVQNKKNTDTDFWCKRTTQDSKLNDARKQY